MPAITPIIILLALPLALTDTYPVCPKPTILTVTKNYQTLMDLEMFGEATSKPYTFPKKMKYSTRFMLDLYNILSTEAEESVNRPKRYSYYHSRLRDDEIVTAGISDEIVSMNSLSKKGVSVGQKQKLLFSMKEIPNDAKAIGAELKIYQKAVPNTMRAFTILVYRQYRKGPMKNSHKFMKKISEKSSSTSYTGWLSIDVTRTYRTWLKNRTETEALFVTAQLLDVQDDEIHPTTLGVVFHCPHKENEPFIVAFLRAPNDLHSRIPRHIMQPLSKPLSFEQMLLSNDEKCSVHKLKVNFKELGWHDFVIAPKTYTTGYCRGTCDFPIKNSGTNHALVQSLMQVTFPDLIPKPACAPMETSHLSVLFKGEFNTVLKNYKGMVVHSCKCQ
ncbi:bone morphogenetic protein 7-like [Euwallacea fornicatus]|uniref:bone morphogenetic protein 7-like n=1 Tax=Euwallacea fornicatus TaxID=995702 RepID=UPI0033906F9F